MNAAGFLEHTQPGHQSMEAPPPHLEPSVVAVEPPSVAAEATDLGDSGEGMAPQQDVSMKTGNATIVSEGCDTRGVIFVCAIE